MPDGKRELADCGFETLSAVLTDPKQEEAWPPTSSKLAPKTKDGS